MVIRSSTCCFELFYFTAELFDGKSKFQLATMTGESNPVCGLFGGSNTLFERREWNKKYYYKNIIRASNNLPNTDKFSITTKNCYQLKKYEHKKSQSKALLNIQNNIAKINW